MKKRYYLALCGMTLSVASVAQKIEEPVSTGYKTSFAIVVDDITYEKAQKEIQDYRASLEKRGLGTYIVSHKWKNPDEIKAILQNLHHRKPRLEGVVLVGDIPIPMIRDAQHLTSVFKMDQRIAWQKSSVPSDRFYDDFDLKFNFLKQDSLKTNLFYYSLNSASPQEIIMDIYSARIKPPAIAGKDQYQQIKDYLVKAVAQSKQHVKLDNALFFSGYGYHSESLNALGGEHIALKEQFPGLFRPGSVTKFMNFRMARFMKFPLLSELNREDLDLAVFHGHGDDETQLINGYPYASNPQPSIDNVKLYLRSKVQAADKKKQNVQELKQGFVEKWGVPMAWMEDALVDSVLVADSLFNASRDISIADIKATRPNTRFMMMDACDNGSFEEEDYIAGHYVFGSGKNVLVMANSVGVLQDQWATEMLGLVQYGVRFGNWLKEVAYLETHLFGDPAFTFEGNQGADLNNMMVNEAERAATWEKLLSHKSPDVQSLALAHLYRIRGNVVSGLLKETYFSSDYGTTRLECLKLLNKQNNTDYQTVLAAAVNDPYELIRRLAVTMIGHSGDDKLVPTLVSAMLSEVKSERVSYNIRSSLDKMNGDVVIAETNRQIKETPYLTDGNEIRESVTTSANNTKRKLEKDYGSEAFAKKTDKEKMANLGTLRAYNYNAVVPEIVKITADKKESLAVRMVALEALSWFKYAYNSSLVKDLCDTLLKERDNDPALTEQALKTQKIINSVNSVSSVSASKDL
ncbi:HEAT repeat domain-containing protein [Dyadobacter sp. LHD-138]|uniref:HEAT repeat domain-containing protein n=1 Tax=Dyadobacter sp. LHD-138 TaxID=3071413 RepID=UPI0027DF2E95|nr:HEAT repeat domain-containing protein [Dyadobacter sp. LHD-138]MDQ6481845.1 HEAT repeat domain-containing protein [Dyadobacter sp. LHD-138]